MKEKILMLHGALGSKKQFVSLKAKLEESYDVYTMDFQGHGEYISESEFSIELFSNNVIEFLKTNSIDSTHIFGYSMGGYVALVTALKIPNKIETIITLGTKFNWSKESAATEVKGLNPQKIEEKIPHFAEKLSSEHYPQDWKAIMNKTARMMLNMSQGAKLRDKDFQSINLFVVIGIGSLDKMVSFEESEYVSTLLPQCELVKLKDVKHPIDRIELSTIFKFITSSLAKNILKNQESNFKF